MITTINAVSIHHLKNFFLVMTLPLVNFTQFAKAYLAKHLFVEYLTWPLIFKLGEEETQNPAKCPNTW